MRPKYVEKRGNKYWPTQELKKIAWAANEKVYEEAAKDPIKFWEEHAKKGITWEKFWDKPYEEKLPYFSWFKGSQLNFCYNCLDRHIEEGRGKNTALIWVPEPTSEKTVKLTFNELFDKVKRFANALKKYGVKKSDVVAIYLPLIPEAAIAMLACARIGAIHSVVFSAFSAEALKARIEDGKAKILVTADGYFRRGEEENLLDKASQAAKGTTVKQVIVVRRLKKSIPAGYKDFEKEIKDSSPDCGYELMNSEDILFILYTSGTTGKPKGIVHDTGGYAIQAYLTCKWNFSLHEDDMMWCTADIGWITGHSYAVYGPLLNATPTLLYEGSPDYPKPDRWWQIIEENRVTVFYTAPTAIRMFIKFGEKWIKDYKLDSLRVLGTVGEPIDVDAWEFYFQKIGKASCPVIDTWWQTETGGTLINALPGVGPFIPTIAGRSFPGTRHTIVDDKGRKIKTKDKTGNLVQVSPFAPGMLHGVYKNHKKYVETYWRFKTKYDTSDGAYFTRDGYIRITGRTDDVMKVAGHRLPSAEVENAIAEYQGVVECAVVPKPDEVKGQVPVAFVVLKKGASEAGLEEGIKKQVDKKIGPTARPAKVYVVSDLPKTRSGKIMRRILKAILVGEEPEGLITLVNPEAVEQIKDLLSQKSK